jgi:hypothetical protein
MREEGQTAQDYPCAQNAGSDAEHEDLDQAPLHEGQLERL